MKHKMQIFLVTIISILTCHITTIKASSDITCKVRLYRITEEGLKEIPNGFDYQTLAKEETIKVIYDIYNTGEPVTINISFPKTKGMEITPETIEGISLTNTFSLEVDASIDVNATIESQIEIEAIHTDGEITSHAFSFQHQIYYPIKDNKKEHLVTFYGMNNQVLSTQRIPNKGIAKIPIYTVPGYEIEGFNTKKDGSGKTYQGTSITSNQNFYAIYKPITYSVYYHVDDEIYKTDEVTYGARTMYIEAPKKKDKTFIGWYGQLENIKEDIHVYAMYKDVENNYYLDNRKVTKEEQVYIQKFEVSSTKVKEYKGETTEVTIPTDTNEYYMFMNEEGEVYYGDEVMDVPNDGIQIPWAIVFICSSLLSVYSGYVYIKKRKRNKKI